MVRAEVISYIIDNILETTFKQYENIERKKYAREIVAPLVENLISKIPIGENIDSTHSSELLFSYPDEQTKDISNQIVPDSEYEDLPPIAENDEIELYDEKYPSKCIQSLKFWPAVTEENDNESEILQIVPENCESVEDLEIGCQAKPPEQAMNPLKVSTNSLVMTFNSGQKRQIEEPEEIVYHTLCGVAMPNLLNAVPRLGLSKSSKLTKLHKRMKL